MIKQLSRIVKKRQPTPTVYVERDQQQQHQQYYHYHIKVVTMTITNVQFMVTMNDTSQQPTATVIATATTIRTRIGIRNTNRNIMNIDTTGTKKSNYCTTIINHQYPPVVVLFFNEFIRLRHIVDAAFFFQRS